VWYGSSASGRIGHRVIHSFVPQPRYCLDRYWRQLSVTAFIISIQNRIGSAAHMHTCAASKQPKSTEFGNRGDGSVSIAYTQPKNADIIDQDSFVYFNRNLYAIRLPTN
jgi:hypothetical protein